MNRTQIIGDQFSSECVNKKSKYILEIKELTFRLLLEYEKDYFSSWATPSNTLILVYRQYIAQNLG